MTILWWILACGLLLNVAVGLGFVTSRPGGADALLAALLLGTTGVALVLVLGKVLDQRHAVDVALVFALLAAVLGVTFVRRGWLGGDEEGDRGQ
jgi:multicomponent Na+:H+ antiporter subunit F